MKGSDAFIILYDVMNDQSFKNIMSWIDEINIISKNVPVLILGNKMDMLKNTNQKEIELKKIERLNIPIHFSAGLISVKRNKFYGKEVNMGFIYGIPQNKIFKKVC